MATIPAVLSLAEYLQATYKPDCDFVDDHIEERCGSSTPATGSDTSTSRVAGYSRSRTGRHTGTPIYLDLMKLFAALD